MLREKENDCRHMKKIVLIFFGSYADKREQNVKQFKDNDLPSIIRVTLTTCRSHRLVCLILAIMSLLWLGYSNRNRISLQDEMDTVFEDITRDLRSYYGKVNEERASRSNSLLRRTAASPTPYSERWLLGVRQAKRVQEQQQQSRFRVQRKEISLQVRFEMASQNMSRGHFNSAPSKPPLPPRSLQSSARASIPSQLRSQASPFPNAIRNLQMRPCNC